MGIMDNSAQDSKKYGLRIYTIIKNGPLDKCGVSELVDFIIPPEEVLTNQISFEEWVQTHSNQEIVLSFYSLLTKRFRDLKIKTNPLGSKEGIIGASVRKENWTTANKKILHIVSIKENSFSQKELGLIPNEDYIVGVKCKSTPIVPLNNDEFSPLEMLAEAVNKYKGYPVKFYIYNKTKGARDVTAVIGNDYYFSLGLEGAFGALHMFPSLDMEKREANNEISNNINKTNEENKEINENKINNLNENKDKNKNVDISGGNKKEETNEIKEEISDNKVNKDNKENHIDYNINTEIKENREIKKINIEKTLENNEVNIDNKNEKENQNNNIKIDDIKEENKNQIENETQINKNDVLKPSNNNINQIVEEITVEKDLENNAHPHEENKNYINTENKINVEENINTEKLEEKITEIKEDNKEDLKVESNQTDKIEIKEEKMIEIKKEDLLENIITHKEESNQKNDEDKKEIENKKSDEIKEEGQNIEEEKNKEKENENTEENKNTNSSSGNKNKRRKKRNKH